MGKSIQVHNWSRYPVVNANVHTFRTESELREIILNTPKVITRGSGLSYGDASLGKDIVSTIDFNKILEFDSHHGMIRCEAGVTLEEILTVIVPKGWFLPVTPGTKFITLGGAVAADVHGKNHHKEGSIGKYITNLKVMLADGSVVCCGPDKQPEIFHATCGGMGLSGVVLEIGLRLKKISTSYILQENIMARNLRELTGLLKKYNDRTYSVAWVDCLTTGKNMGRGVLMLGEHVDATELPLKYRRQPLVIHKTPRLSVPFEFPSFALSRFSIGMFNRLFNWKHSVGPKSFVTHYDAFFYPLDFILQWNRMYGRRGFLQYQFVIPFEKGEDTLSHILELISRSKLASFLSVLKLLGESEHAVAFPMPGYTLALDLPVTRELFPLLDQLDEIVTTSGGRIYLAKDARMKPDAFKKGYPGLNQFTRFLRDSGASVKFESLLSKRLF